MQRRKTLAQSLKCLKVSFCIVLYIFTSLSAQISWNKTVLAFVTEKYMEFDLNDKGEIGEKKEKKKKHQATFPSYCC